MTEFLFDPVSWLIAAVVLLTIELLVVGFDFVGMSVGALLTGILLFFAVDLIREASYGAPLILLFFAAATFASWLLLRKLMGTRSGQVKNITRDINDD